MERAQKLAQVAENITKGMEEGYPMTRRIVVSLFLAGLMIASGEALASNAITWSSGGQTIKDKDNVNYLTGSRTDPTIGGLVQLIVVGTAYDGLNLGAINGCAGDDFVARVAYIGLGTPSVPPPGPSPNGRFSRTADAYLNSPGTKFVIRWFDTPAASGTFDVNNPNNAQIPLSGFYNYDDKVGLYYVSTTSATDSFTMSGAWTTPRPVPEPGTLALFGLGLVTVVAARRLQKRN